MKPKEIIKALGPWMKRVLRPAWRPVVERGDGTPTASKFCGTPWTGPKAPWPMCAACKTPLALFLQLRLSELPGSLPKQHGSGLLQLFYCCNDECHTAFGFTPFEDKVSRVRIIRPTPRGNTAPPPPDYQHLPAKRIVGWKRFEDLPDADEHEEHGFKRTYDHEANTIRLECPEVDLDITESSDECQIEDIAAGAGKDKLAGWPYWVQGMGYPSCPKCKKRMILLFQLGSEDHIDFMFGDVGTGHITQCPEHKDVVAFGWAGS